MADITFVKRNETHTEILCDSDGIYQELYEHFSFEQPGAIYHPRVKLGIWDGKIRLFDKKTRLIYTGLLDAIIQFAVKDGYTWEDFRVKSTITPEAAFATVKDCYKKEWTPRSYQFMAFFKAIKNRRSLLLSPTSSGKTLIAFLIVCFYLKTIEKSRILIIVPTIDLVSQMAEDFENYQKNIDISIHKITGGVDKNNKSARIFLSTWQSIYELPRRWFEQFNVVIGDEAHLFKAKSLTSIMSKLSLVEYRTGMTGTLDGTETNEMILRGLFGSVYQVIRTHELMQQGKISQLRTRCIKLMYSDDERKAVKGLNYQEEVSFLTNHVGRNNFIKNLALSLKGNTLILFNFTHHGETIRDLMPEDRIVHFVNGQVEKEDRKYIRKIVNTEDNSIVIASQKTFATGTSINRLHNVIFAHPSKSKITVLQSIGRVLRKGEGKDFACLFDIVDDLQWKTKANYTLIHYYNRTEYYKKEKFNYEVVKIKL